MFVVLIYVDDDTNEIKNKWCKEFWKKMKTNDVKYWIKKNTNMTSNFKMKTMNVKKIILTNYNNLNLFFKKTITIINNNVSLFQFFHYD